METKRKASNILEELRTAGKIPTGKETEMLDLIDRMVRSRPETEVDPKFFARLRERLLDEALCPDRKPEHRGAFWTNFAKFFSVPVALAGIAAIASTLGIFELLPTKSEIPTTTTGTVAFKSLSVDNGPGIVSDTENPEIEKTDRKPVAVRADATAPKTDERNSGISETAERTFSTEPPTEDRSLEDFDAELNGIENDGVPAGGGSDDGAMGLLSIPAPEGLAMKASPMADMAPSPVRYSFSGTLPPLPSEKIYRRISATSVPNVSADGLSGFADENSWDVSIVRNFETWPEWNEEKPEVLTDFEIVSVVESFARHAGFDLSRHAKPSVKRDGGSATVSYAALLGGIGIFDEYGYPKTSWFSVDLSDKRVSGGFFVNLNVSEMPAGKRAEDREILERVSGGPTSPNGGRTVEIRTATPCYVLKYVEIGGIPKESLVPGYRFEIPGDLGLPNPVVAAFE